MIANSNFNKKFLELFEKHLPDKNIRFNLLKDTMFLGKEAAYRRLRGDVPFSLTEACFISEKLGISLDSIINNATKENIALFELPLSVSSNIEDYSEYYYENVYKRYINFIELADNNKLSLMTTAQNSYPDSMIFPYSNLLKFNILKWMYQMSNESVPTKFSDFTLHPEIERTRNEAAKKTLTPAQNNVLILNRNVLTNAIKQLLFFQDLNLLDKDDLLAIKGDVLDLIQNLERLAMLGRTSDNKQVWLYLSSIEFDADYTYFEGTNTEFSVVDVYQMHSLTTNNSLVCRMQKEWIESLQRYSILISASNERQRRSFFEEQRKLIVENL